MKIDRRIDTREDDKRHNPRPAGETISWTQLSMDCDLRLKFYRAKVEAPPQPLGISLIYGNAAHTGVDAYLRGAAKTPAEAITAAHASLLTRVREAERKGGVDWDDPWEMNDNGTISQAGSNFGSLPNATVAKWWLERQVPFWIAVFGRPKLFFSERLIYVPLTAQPGWKVPYSLECWIDRVVGVNGSQRLEDGYQITDTKFTGSRWNAQSINKGRGQADVYTGAAIHEFGQRPAQDFTFQIFPRVKAALPALELAYEWAMGDEAALQDLFEGGPNKQLVVSKGRGRNAAVAIHSLILDGNDNPIPEWTMQDAYQLVTIPFDAHRINTFLAGVVRPKVTLIELGNFVANPQSWLCHEGGCKFHPVCAFGSGSLL